MRSWKMRIQPRYEVSIQNIMLCIDAIVKIDLLDPP